MLVLGSEKIAEGEKEQNLDCNRVDDNSLRAIGNFSNKLAKFERGEETKWKME